MNTALEILNYIVLLVVVYYAALFSLSLALRRFAPRPENDPSLRFVVVVPARDEDVVIGETVTKLRAINDSRLTILIMDDGSSDDTADTARRAAEDDSRVIVHTRGADIAGRGKGDVLNHGFRLVNEMRATHKHFQNVEPSNIVVSVIDADGWLSNDVLDHVAPYFSDQNVGGVQVAVRIWNARAGFLARMQDIEFVAFCQLVNLARDFIGSTGLGGNGQFVRLEALLSLGDRPWTDSLTEDLDLTLRLLEGGWRNRFCSSAFVAQQGLEQAKPFLKQRTRWIQGHYGCWSHLPILWSRSSKARLAAKIDVSLYLVLVVSIFLFAFTVLLSIISYAMPGWLYVPGSYLDFIENPLLFQLSVLLLTFGPLVVIMVSYRRHTTMPMPLWAYPGIFMCFVAYSYWWGLVASIRALARLTFKRTDWVKTPRSVVRTKDATDHA